jgi:uncharacterized protein
MVFVLCGNSGVGKTTLAIVLSKVFNNEIQVIHGDSFITLKSIDWENLKKVFETEKHIFFEHVSPIAICNSLNIEYDVAIFLGQKDQWDKTTKREYKNAVSNNKRVITGNNFNNLITKIYSLWSSTLQVYPAKISNFVLKVATHCNLNCSYCYMYEYFDNGKQLPSKLMSLECFTQSIYQINKYSLETNSKVTIGLHGGEPLLLGYNRLEDFLNIYRRFQTENPLLSITIQTNGVLLDRELLELFKKYNVSIGISIDGFSEETNINRLYHNGKSSFKDTMKAIELMNQNNFTNFGILSVIGSEIDFRKIVKFTEKNHITSYEFLIQDITHDSKHEKINLYKLFKEWVSSDIEIDVRFFKSLISQACGYNWSVDTIGISPISTLVINTLGEWELLDTLRIVKPDMWKLNYNVTNSSVTDLISSKEMLNYCLNFHTYSKKCLSCNYFLSCGSGYIIHRFQKDTSFLNPSVYCEDLTNIFDFIQSEIIEPNQ